MASSLVVALSVHPPGTRDQIQSSSSISLRSEAFGDLVPKKTCFFAGRPQKKGFGSWSIKVKAMGGTAKYKGTQMREKYLTEMIEKKVKEAKEVCKGDETTDDCKVAWDEVEEVSQAKAHLRVKMEKQDPLESFCQDNPETDECRIYED